MDKNGIFLCSSKSIHVGLKFFWVVGKVKQGKISLKHCLTDKMFADLFTKPLQGSKFKLFIKVIMGWDDVATL